MAERHSSTFGKILVTGATGNVGSLLIPNLTKLGADVRALVRDESKAQGLFPPFFLINFENIRAPLKKAGSLVFQIIPGVVFPLFHPVLFERGNFQHFGDHDSLKNEMHQ